MSTFYKTEPEPSGYPHTLEEVWEYCFGLFLRWVQEQPSKVRMDYLAILREAQRRYLIGPEDAARLHDACRERS